MSCGGHTPSGCQRNSARDAWSTPQDTVQSSDNLESWGTFFAPRSRPPLSYGPHHDPGVPLSIQAIPMLIIRAVIGRHLYRRGSNLPCLSVMTCVSSDPALPLTPFLYLHALDHSQQLGRRVPRLPVRPPSPFQQSDRSSPVIWTQFSFYLPIHQSLAAILGGRCSCLHCPLDGRGTCKAWRIRVCCASGRGRRVTLEVSSKG